MTFWEFVDRHPFVSLFALVILVVTAEQQFVNVLNVWGRK